MKTIKGNKRNNAIPGKAQTQKEFKSLIAEAEQGPFTTIKESKELFQAWRKGKYQLG